MILIDKQKSRSNSYGTAGLMPSLVLVPELLFAEKLLKQVLNINGGQLKLLMNNILVLNEHKLVKNGVLLVLHIKDYN